MTMQLSPDLGPLLTAEDFLPFVNKAFRVEATPEPVEVTLESVDQRTKESWMPRTPFSLLLSTPRNVLLTEGLHRMTPEGGEVLELYIMPIASPPTGRQLYQIVVN